MLRSPYWDPQLMLGDGEKPHILAIGGKIVRSCWAPAFAAAGVI